MNSMIETVIIEDNWDINVRSIEKIKALYSDIYVINEEYVLKITDINSGKKQKIINLCMSKAYEKKLPVPKIIRTKNGELLLAQNHRTYSVSSYLRGHPYDFKERSLAQAAQTLALFHLCFEKEIELEQQVRDICGSVYPYDLSGLKHYNEDVKFVIKLIEQSPELSIDLPRQIGHFDYTVGNLIFENNRMVGLIDFDIMRVSETARDVAIPLYRLTNSVAQQKVFLDSYNAVKQLSDIEIEAMHDLYVDEMKRKLIYTIRRYEISSKPFDVLFDRVKKMGL